MEKILDVQNLQVSFNTYAGEVKAVRGVSFELNAGETLAFVGESGC
ncbi:oligopeptide transport ATP-binding protein OppD, partial [gut metagenome]